MRNTKRMLLFLLVLAPCFCSHLLSQTVPCGQQLSAAAIYRGVPANSNAPFQGKYSDCQEPAGPYGDLYQCVEYIRRFYAERDDLPQRIDSTEWSGRNAVDFYKDPPQGMVVYSNGGLVPPAPDDIMVFSGGTFGHVAIVTGVSTNSVNIVEQNWSRSGVAILPLVSYGGIFTVGARNGGPTLYNVLGWVRAASNSASVLLGTNLPSSGSEPALTSAQFWSQPFTLTSTVQINALRLQMSGFGTDEFTEWLTDSIGPGTSQSNVLQQAVLQFPNTGGGISGQTISIPINETLHPGTYFIVLSSSQTSISRGWILSTTVLPSAVGSVGEKPLTTASYEGGSTDSSFPPASTFVPNLADFPPFAFEVLGVP